jgi:Dolichyl-phosphate-mannose-protein mannosyltransferase
VASPPAVTPAVRAALWILYLVAPGHIGGLLDGVPLGVLDTVALVAVLGLAARGRSIRGARLAAAFAIVAMALSALVPERGFRARYFADAEARGPIEVSTEYRSRIITRVDSRLDFSPRRLDFPLAFFNDVGRFVVPKPTEPDRERLPFAVSWDGQWHVDTARRTTLYIDAREATSAELVLDGTRVAAVSAGQGNTTAAVDLKPGWHRLDVRFSSPYGSPRRFSAGEVVNDRRIPFDATTVVTRRMNSWELWLERLLVTLKTAVDVCALAWLALLVAFELRAMWLGRGADGGLMTLRQRFLAWFALVATIEALLFASPWLTRLTMLVPNDDPMTYETYARDIQLHGLLLKSVEGPYYYQVFYPYFLAVIHTLFGEGMFGLVFVQRVLVAFVVWMVVEIAVEIGRERVWPSAFAAAALVAYVKFAPLVASPSTESLFVPLLAWWTLLLIRACRHPSRRRVAGAGLVGGLAALTRSTAVLAWAAAIPACWMAWKHTGRRASLAATLLACSCAVFAMIALRNAIVVREFVPMPTEFAITLLGGNELPAGVHLDFTKRGPLYDRLGVNSITRQVVEYAIIAPGAFARNLGRKALFALGYFEPYAAGWGYSLVFLGVSLGSAVGFVLAWRSGVAPAAIVCLPGLIALSQFLAVVVVYPKGERLILPFHIILIPYAALALDRLLRLRFVVPVRTWGPASAGPTLIVAAALYTLFIRTRGITDHFLMLREQIRDWNIALGSLSSLPLVGTASTAGGHTFGPIFYWVLWLIRVTIGPFTGNLPHAGGIGLSLLQSVADVVLGLGIRRATGSWVFAVATVLIVASSPFDLALSSVIWNPVLAVAFAKVGTGLVLSWQDQLTRPRRVILAAVAWFAVQAHSAALPFALAMFLWILWTQFRHGRRALQTAVIEAALVVFVLQIPAMFARESIRPTKIVAAMQEPQELRAGDAYRAVNDAVGSIGFSPFAVPQPTLILLAAVAAVLLIRGPLSPIGVVTIVPLALTVAMWSIWQQVYDAYVFLTIVPAALLAILWTTRLLQDSAARGVSAAALLVAAILSQQPRIQSAALVFRMTGYGALVRGSRTIADRGEPVRAIEVPFLHPLSDSEYLFTLVGGRLQRDAPTVARVSENGEVTYVR